MTGLAIGLIKARDEISEVVVVVFFLFFFIADKTFRTWLLDTFVLVFNVMLEFMQTLNAIIHLGSLCTSMEEKQEHPGISQAG